MLFRVEQMLKFSNLTNWMNNQNHGWMMKIWPKIENLNMTSYDRIFILDHEETCLIRLWDVFHEIRVKIIFYNPWWKVCLMGFDERKSLKFDERMPCVWKMCEMFKFSYLENFFSLHKLWWDEKYWKHRHNPLFSWKSQVNSHFWALLFLSKAKFHKWGS